MLHASIIVIGNEILEGYVRDTNSGWLASRLHEHGVPPDRVVVVPDDDDAIGGVLEAELDRERPRLVLTCGGLGSTPDDRTYEAVARSLGRELVEEPELEARVRDALAWQRSMGVDVDDEQSDHMLRIARVPAGATLMNKAGSFIPGVRVDVDGGIDAAEGATLVILPGVPAHLKRIVEGEVLPDLVTGRNDVPHVIEIEHRFPESMLNPCIAAVMEEFPDVAVGSYPGTPMTVRLAGEPERVEAAAERVRRDLEVLAEDPATARLADAWQRRFGDSAQS